MGWDDMTRLPLDASRSAVFLLQLFRLLKKNYASDTVKSSQTKPIFKSQLQLVAECWILPRCKVSTCAARAAPPFGITRTPPHSLVSRVSRASRVSHPCSPCSLSHLGPIPAKPSALARVPTPPPASLISLFPFKTHLVPCFAE